MRIRPWPGVWPYVYDPFGSREYIQNTLYCKDKPAFPELVARVADDSALRERVEKLSLLTRERVHKHAKWFQACAERGRVVELSGTHDLIVSNPREVLEQIEAFMSSLQKKR